MAYLEELLFHIDFIVECTRQFHVFTRDTNVTEAQRPVRIGSALRVACCAGASRR